MSEPVQSGMRAGHADRETVVARLNTAFAEGRLEVAELDERIAAAYAAKTLGELVPLTADLPAVQAPAARPAPPASRPAPAPSRSVQREFSQLPVAGEPSMINWTPLGGAVALLLVNLLVWVVVSISTGDLAYFWPIWTAIPLVLVGAGMIGTAVRSRGED